MNPCVYAKFLTIDEEEAEKAADLGLPPTEYWVDFSFKIFNIESYWKQIDNGVEVGTTVNFLQGDRYTIDISFDELRKLEDAFYSSEESKWLNLIN